MKTGLLQILPALFVFGPLCHKAYSEERQWKNSDGTKTFIASLISRDEKTVTLKGSQNGKEYTLPLEKLHQNDRDYLAENHPFGDQFPPGNAFDTLNFGDHKDLVVRKLKASKIVESKLQDELIGRTGLNGIFQTKTLFGGKPCYLDFAWRGERLHEVTLQTHPVTEGYQTNLKKVWEELLDTFTQIQGKPATSTPYPTLDQLDQYGSYGSHLWRLEGGHSALLGTAKTHNGFTVWLRTTADRIDPVTTP